MDIHDIFKGVLISLCLLHITAAHRILIVSVNTRSHLLSAVQLAKVLQTRPNDVTIFTGSNLPISDSYKSLGIHFEQYAIPDNLSQDDEIVEDVISSHILQGSYSIAALRSMFRLITFMQTEQAAMFNDEAAMNRLIKSKFDFIIIDSIATPLYALPYLLDRPFAVFGFECPVGAFRMPYSPSFVPNMVTQFTDNMSLWQRMVNVLLHAITSSGVAWWMKTTASLVPQKPTLPIADLFAEAQLCLRTRAPYIDTVRPTQPNVIETNIIGRPANPLTSELENILHNAEYSSVVVASFGSWLDKLPESVMVRFITAFAQLKMTVLWKYTGHLELDIPSNVYMMTWIPQNDLLGHNQTKLLITHGGLYSITEALYHGVPMITFPILFDQQQNSIVAQSKGIAKTLPRNFQPNDLIQMINDTQQDSMVATTRRASEIFRSMSETGSSTAFWVDHVIRFGGKDLRPASMDLWWWQYLMLDVAFCYILLIWLVWRIGCKFISCVLRGWPKNRHVKSE